MTELIKNIYEKISFIFQYFKAKNIFILIGMIFIFFLALRPPNDPDMGWHIMNGKYLSENHYQIAKKDIFSHSMPDFPLIMHEWVNDIAIFNIYNYFGFFGITLFYAFIITAAFVIAAWGVSAKTEYKIIAALLGIIAGAYIIGTKAQMFSLLGLASTVCIIFKFRKNPQTKLINWLPLIFLIWVNFHGGFAAGLFCLGLFLGLEFLKKFWLYIFEKKKKVNIIANWLKGSSLSWKVLEKLSFIFSLSILATLINPYGWRLYIEVVTTVFDSYAKATIQEWLPFNATNPIAFQLETYLILLGLLLLMSFRKIDFTYLSISLVFLYLAFSSWRHVPVFIIISIPFWVAIVEQLAGAELSKLINRKWFLFLFFLALVVVGYQKIKIIPPSYSLERLSQEGNYPLGAVKYLKENPIEGNLFNEYNWGGFLIWQYPEKKVYIDGRMASWRVGDRRILEEFNKTMEHKDGWENILNKYNVSRALVYNNTSNEIAFLNLGWKVAYRDYLSIVFEKTTE